jgi:hypothetical protein
MCASIHQLKPYMSFFYGSIGSHFGFQQANLPLEMQTALFSVFTVGAVLLTIYLVLVRFPWVAERLGKGIERVIAALTGNKREARLNKVVCYHCNKGMGLYNPVYFMVEGEPHIKGTCSLCGEFVRVRLN